MRRAARLGLIGVCAVVAPLVMVAQTPQPPATPEARLHRADELFAESCAATRPAEAPPRWLPHLAASHAAALLARGGTPPRETAMSGRVTAAERGRVLVRHQPWGDASRRDGLRHSRLDRLSALFERIVAANARSTGSGR